MNDQQRTRLLAGTLAAAVAVYLGRAGVTRLIFEPVSKAEKAVSTAEATLESVEQKDFALAVARKHLDDWRAISLPENQLNAQRLYREWVESLAQQCAFGSLIVEPGRRPERSGRYLSVAVEVKAETDLASLSRFLFLFDRASLLHRLSSLNIKSTGAVGNPRLDVSFTAEGISVNRTGERKELFSRSSLSADAASDAAEIRVASSDSFPEGEPFQIRIGREILQVKSADGSTWKVDRGLYGTKPEVHSASAVVELLPVLWDRQDKSIGQYSDLLTASPFAVAAPPRVWNPKISGLSSQTIAPGAELELTAAADDINPDLGASTFSLKDAPEGMVIDAASGKIRWKTTEALAPGTYSAQITMVQSGAPEAVYESPLTVTVRIPNSPPTLAGPDQAIVILGQKFELQLKAEDDGPAEGLSYSITSGAQDGLALEAQSGLMSWTPPGTFAPGDYDVEVQVKDSGDGTLTAAKKIKLVVKDDAAILTLLTGAVSKDEVWYAWFRNKGTGEKQQLKIGQRLVVAEIDAEVVGIEPRTIRFSDSAGIWELPLGSSVRERRLIKPVTSPEQPATAEQPESQPAP